MLIIPAPDVSPLVQPSRPGRRFIQLLSALLPLAFSAQLSATPLPEFEAMQWTEIYRNTAFVPSANWTLSFTDDFAYDPTLANLKSDTGSTGPWFVPGHAPYGVGNFVKIGETEFPNTYISLASGGLRMRAHRATSTSTTWYPAGMTSVSRTGAGFAARYGYFELYGQLPASAVQGTLYDAWPAFWLLTMNEFENPHVTNRVEIDALEWYANDKYNHHHTVHLIPPSGGRKILSDTQAFRPTDLSAGPHSFGIKVTPTWVVIYLDRLEITRFPTVEEFTFPKYVLVNSAVHNSTGNTDFGETEWNFDVDNVSVWTMPEDIAVDNTDATGVTISSGWTSASVPSGFLGADFLHDGGAGKGSRSVTFTPNLPCDGTYQVYTRWTAASDRAINVPYTIVHANGSQTVTKNQTIDGGQWNLLGTYSFNEGTGGSVTVANTGTPAGKYVVADAVRFVLQDPWLGSPALPPRAPVQVVATPGDASVAVSWSSSPGGPFIDNTSSAITYSGTWTHSLDAKYFNGSKSYSNTTGSYAQMTFTGTGLRIFMKKDQSFGRCDIYVDDLVTPVANIDAYSATPLYQQAVYENLGLATGSHTVRIQVTGQKNAASTGYTIALDNFEVLPASLSYSVKRATAAGGPYTTVASNLTGLSYVDSGLVNGTTYYYVVSATNANGAGPNSPVAKAQPSSAIRIVDNKDVAQVVVTGDWMASAATPGFYGDDYLHDKNAGATGGKSVRFTPNLPAPGPYEVSMRWVTGQSRAYNAPVDITHAAGTTTTNVNQQAYNGQWVPLGQFVFNAGTAGSALLRNDGTNAYVIADAVRFLLAETPLVILDNLSPGVTTTGAWTSSTNTAGFYGTDYLHDGAAGKGTKTVQFTPTLSAGTYEVFAYWPAAGTRFNAVPFAITHAGGVQNLLVNQQATAATWVSLGTYTFNGGTSGNVLIATTGTSNYVIVDAVKFVRQ